MATSSIFHNFVINDPKRFMDAYEESERWCAEHPREYVPTRELSDDELKELWEKMKHANRPENK